MNEFKPSLLESQNMSTRMAPGTRRRAGLAAAIGAMALIGVAGASLAVLRSSAAPALGVAAPQAVPVTVATIASRDVAIWTDFSGRLEAVGSVAIRPRVQGAIIAAHFREGSLVRQGDVLFTIDPAPYLADIARLEAQVAAAGARLVLAARQQQRGFALGSADDLAKSEVDSRVNEYRAADANLHAAMASLQTARLNLDWTQVRAPIAGRVGRIEITPGNLVDAGSTAPVLTTLVSVDPIYASFDADEQSVADAVASLPKTGDLSRTIGRIPVDMGTLADDGTPAHGVLQLLDNVVDAGSGTIRVRAVFDNADGRLMPGQFARLRMGQASTKPAITIEERAITIDQDRRFVMVVGPGNKVVSRQVVLGGMEDGRRIVTAGLRDGERIVVDGLQRIRPGAVVAPQDVAENVAPGTRTTLAAR